MRHPTMLFICGLKSTGGNQTTVICAIANLPVDMSGQTRITSTRGYGKIGCSYALLATESMTTLSEESICTGIGARTDTSLKVM